MQAVRVTIHLNESDPWRRILDLLKRERAAHAAVYHSAGGFNGRGPIHVSGLVDAGGDLPVMLMFVDAAEHAARLLPKIRALAPDRLIVSENVLVEQGELAS